MSAQLIRPIRSGDAVRIGRHDLEVLVAGRGLVPTASGAACCCCSSSSSIRRGAK